MSCEATKPGFSFFVLIWCLHSTSMWPTDGHTEHSVDICSNKLHLMHSMQAMRPRNVKLVSCICVSVADINRKQWPAAVLYWESWLRVMASTQSYVLQPTWSASVPPLRTASWEAHICYWGDRRLRPGVASGADSWPFCWYYSSRLMFRARLTNHIINSSVCWVPKEYSRDFACKSFVCCSVLNIYNFVLAWS